MLHGEHLRAAMGDGRSQARVRYCRGSDRNVHGLRQIHPTEHDACVGLRRAQRQLHALAAVKTNTYGLGEGLKGSLFEHGLILMNPLSVCLLAQEGRDFVVVHAARRQGIDLGSCRGTVATPDGGRVHGFVVRLRRRRAHTKARS